MVKEEEILFCLPQAKASKGIRRPYVTLKQCAWKELGTNFKYIPRAGRV